MRTIRVTGKANMKVAPDQTKIELTIKGFAKLYSEALSKSVEDAKIIKDAIASCGIDRDSLKTENFYTSEKTKSIKDQYGNTTYKQIGYDVTHCMNFTFDNNNEILGKVLYVLSKLSINPRISISYVVKDSEKYKDDLIALAVKDAKRKALAMANAAQVNLGDILNMDYSYQTVTFETREYLRMDSVMLADSTESFDIDMLPEDMDLTDSVTITWEII